MLVKWWLSPRRAGGNESGVEPPHSESRLALYCAVSPAGSGDLESHDYVVRAKASDAAIPLTR
ncbi:hypothetical protein FJY63_07700 [Candidatus Sumerlaeota bacterium]|nr:hypothetical protein [Candidatus Sumerlaeota bacterium]